jgi:hypothetical protein
MQPIATAAGSAAATLSGESRRHCAQKQIAQYSRQQNRFDPIHRRLLSEMFCALDV